MHRLQWMLSLTRLISEVIHFPLPTAESQSYCSILATGIKFVGFSRNADVILQVINGDAMPHSGVWLAAETDVVFLDRNRLTCAKALLKWVVSDIKASCRYNIHKAPIPRGVIRLFHNSFLLTNISYVHMRCLAQSTDDGVMDKTIKLSDNQTIYSFD